MAFDELFYGFGMLGGVLSAVIYMAVLAPPFIYAFLRWRTLKGDLPADRHLTLRIGLSMFETLGLILLLVALTLIGQLVLAGDDIEGSHLGVLVASAIIYGVHKLVLARLPARTEGAVRRAYRAFRILIFGAVGTVAVVLFFAMLFDGELGGDVGELSIVLLLVWGTAWVLQAMFLFQDSPAPPPVEAEAPPG